MEHEVFLDKSLVFKGFGMALEIGLDDGVPLQIFKKIGRKVNHSLSTREVRGGLDV